MLLQMSLFHLFMTEKYSIVHMYYILFIHSSVGGHLDCFDALAIVNSAALKTGLHVLFQIMVSSGKCPRVGLLDKTIALFLVF